MTIADRHRLSADGAAVLCSGRTGHGSRPRRRHAAATISPPPWRSRPSGPILIDKFLENAIEAEADAIADGTDAFVPAVMEHIELAGVHSGDSACVIPPVSIPQKHIETINEYTRKIAIELNVVGLMNIQYAIAERHGLYPGGQSAGVPDRSAGLQGLQHFHGRHRHPDHAGKKLGRSELEQKADPSFRRQGSGLSLQHVPRSGSGAGPGNAIHRRSAGHGRFLRPGLFQGPGGRPGRIPLEGTVLITIADRDKPAALEPVRRFRELGFTIMATEGTHQFLKDNGIETRVD